jgi:hypothetical protein
MDGLHPKVIQRIDKPLLHSNTGDSTVQIDNVAYIGSYNWIEGSPPMIIVPGEGTVVTVLSKPRFP